MSLRYTLTQGVDPRSTLVADVCEKIDDQAIAALKGFMHDHGCANALLFDEDVCILLRDAFTELSPASIVEERRIPTRLLLGTLGRENAGSLYVRVGNWLELLSRGTALVHFARTKALVMLEHIGCRLVTVDAYLQSVAFHERVGFARCKASQYRERKNVSMWLDALAEAQSRGG